MSTLRDFGRGMSRSSVPTDPRTVLPDSRCVTGPLKVRVGAISGSSGSARCRSSPRFSLSKGSARGRNK